MKQFTRAQYLRNHIGIPIAAIIILVCAVSAFMSGFIHVGHIFIHSVWFIALVCEVNFHTVKANVEKQRNAGGVL